MNGVRQGLGVRTTLTWADVRALSDPSVAPDVMAVAPLVSRSGLVMTAGAQTWTSAALGTTPSFLVTAARFITGQRLTLESRSGLSRPLRHLAGADQPQQAR